MKGLIRFFLNHIPRKYLQLFSHFGARGLGLLYIGNKVECPVCGHHYKKFLPYGYVSQRENALCPHCLSLERHRLMWLWLKEKSDFFTANHKVLHVAPEYAFLKRFEKFSNLDYITADLESPLAKVKMDIQNIPFPENSFDVIFCNHILEHVDDYQLALHEMYRVMKPGGWGIIQSPINVKREATFEDKSIVTHEERIKAFGQYDHVREFGLDYAERLGECGFHVSIEKLVEEIGDEKIARYGLLSYDAISAEEYLYVVHKN